MRDALASQTRIHSFFSLCTEPFWPAPFFTKAGNRPLFPPSEYQLRILLEPALCDRKFGTKPANLAPKSDRMIHFFQMSQLVEHNIIPHKYRRLDESPIQ